MKITAGAVTCAILLSTRALAEDNNRVPANAGTGPYLTAVQSGVIDSIPGPESTLPILVWDVVARMSRLLATRGLEGAEARSAFSSLQTQLKRLAANHPNSTLFNQDFKNIAEVKAQVGTAVVIGYIDKYIPLPRQTTFEAVQHDTAKYERARILGLKTGAFFGRGDEAMFATVLFSPGESNPGQANRLAMFTSATAFAPLRSGRASVGFAFGNPDALVFTTSVGSFFSPAAYDLGFGVSWQPWKSLAKPSSNQPNTEDEYREAVNQMVQQPVLLDHIRAKDLWINGSWRQVGGDSNSGFAKGSIWEGSIVYGFAHPKLSKDDLKSPDSVGLNPIPCTTITISTVGSSRRELRVSEWAAEIRGLIGQSHNGEAPVFLSARYGTRQRWTIALETRF